MQIKKMINLIPILMCATALSIGSLPPSGFAAVEAAKQAAAVEDSTLKGKILGKSNKAGTITIEDKDLGPTMVRFTENTKGLEHAEKGEAAIIKFTQTDGDRIATEIKPKLAKLPEGVTEIMPKELAELIAGNRDFLLIDSRPAKPYAAGHIPTAVSIPVENLEKEGEVLLPKDTKDKLLVFYCGGPT